MQMVVKAANMGETLVTISFNPIGNKTEMVFRQTNFPTAELRDSHNGGWFASAFKCLRDFVTALIFRTWTASTNNIAGLEFAQTSASGSPGHPRSSKIPFDRLGHRRLSPARNRFRPGSGS